MDRTGKSIKIEHVAQFESYGVIVIFSDGTRADNPVEESLELRPYRAPAEDSIFATFANHQELDDVEPSLERSPDLQRKLA